MMLAPGSRQNLLTTGNGTLDKFLGGGLISSSLNIFERQGPSSRILDVVINKTIATSTLMSKKVLLYLNFNTSSTITQDELLASLPSQRKVKSEVLYKDIRGKSEAQKIKIAWRYSSQGISSPTDGVSKVDQVDFGVPLIKSADKEELGTVEVMNVKSDESLAEVISAIRKIVLDHKTSQSNLVVIVKDLLHPFNPIINSKASLIQFLYALRCLSRSLTKGAIVVSYDMDLCSDYPNIQQQLFNIADSVVSFYSYETGENLITGYEDIDGTLALIKVPKVNSFGFHFQQGLSDWCYRFTKNNRFFVVDELSLPPCDNDQDQHIDRKLPVSDPNKIDNIQGSSFKDLPIERF